MYSHVSTKAQVFTTFTHIGTCYYLIIYLNLGVFGASMALNITYGLNFIIQEVYVNFVAWEELKVYSAFLCSADTLKGWGRFLKLGIPGTFMQCFEWWAFEILAIFSGILGTVYLAAHVAIINICSLTFMISLGI